MTTSSPAITQITIRAVSNGFVATLFQNDPTAMMTPTELVFSTFADIETYLKSRGFIPAAATSAAP